MDLYILQKVVMKLMAVIAASSPHGAEFQPPTISFVPHAALEQRVCKRPCPVRAVFIPRHGILLDDRLDPVKDVHARSILLHELVHYVQWKKSGMKSASGCKEWLSREKEAYSLQYKWLSKLTARQTGYAAPRMRRIICQEPPQPSPTTRQAMKQ